MKYPDNHSIYILGNFEIVVFKLHWTLISCNRTTVSMVKLHITRIIDNSKPALFLEAKNRLTVVIQLNYFLYHDKHYHLASIWTQENLFHLDFDWWYDQILIRLNVITLTCRVWQCVSLSKRIQEAPFSITIGLWPVHMHIRVMGTTSRVDLLFD